ncbi:MAG: hypothetical protein V3576_07795, partial [Candidatus Cloacimonadota bacterium]
KADLPLVRHVAATLRANHFKGTAVLADHRLIGFETGDTHDSCYGVAFANEKARPQPACLVRSTVALLRRDQIC